MGGSDAYARMNLGLIPNVPLACFLMSYSKGMNKDYVCACKCMAMLIDLNYSNCFLSVSTCVRPPWFPSFACTNIPVIGCKAFVYQTAHLVPWPLWYLAIQWLLLPPMASSVSFLSGCICWGPPRPSWKCFSYHD